jgi:hypothetical protein
MKRKLRRKYNTEMKELKFAHVIEKKIGYGPLNDIQEHCCSSFLLLQQLPCILAIVWN